MEYLHAEECLGTSDFKRGHREWVRGRRTATKVGGRKMMVTMVKTSRYLFRVLPFWASVTVWTLNS